MNFFVILVFSLILLMILRRKILVKSPNLTSLLEVIIGIAVSMLALPVLIFLVYSIILFEYHPVRKFDIVSWQENKNERFEMRKDLIANEQLFNLSKKELSTTIGLPNGVKNLVTDTLSVWKYKLGCKAWGFGIKCYCLEIEFQNGKSTNIEITESED